ncbi:MAG: HAD-IIIA family hydrolase [Verrucomicrobia subdivision 3 bacterium]|nr:HAD-IIIA family hydrolase [Limisphaerales bacterium]
MKQAIIIAGGMGTRLKARLGDLPKPMIPIGGKPLLEHQVELAKRYGFTEVVIFAYYRPDLIEAHFGDGRRWGVKISYQVEKTPLGTAGAVLGELESLADRFLVFYGDTMVNVDLDRIWEKHATSGADATLLLHPNDHPLDSDLVEMNEAGWITAFHNRPHPAGKFFQNLVNAGLYVIEKEALKPWTADLQSMDFGKDLFPAMLRAGKRLLGYNTPEYIKDIGTPERYDRVSAEHASGVIERSSLRTPQPAVFLDRDGTLNREVDGVTCPEKLELLPGVSEAIHQLNHNGIRALVISNQPIIAKGFCHESDVQAVHNRLETLLGAEHAFVDRIYYCPHHPEKGFEGERAELKIDCDCRKPRIGMIRRAVSELNIDLSQSWLIGDTTTDLQTARNAGIKSILVRTGYAGKDGKYAARPDHVSETLNEAVQFVIRNSPLRR